MKSPVKPVALSVHKDEGCYGLFEGPRQGRWVQVIRVVRGDRLAHYTLDLGPAEAYDGVTPLLMPSYGDDTVGQLQAHAEKNRHDTYWAKRREEMLAESTLIPDILRQEEQLLQVKANRSAFGPGRSVQRNVYPRQAVDRKLKEKWRGNRI